MAPTTIRALDAAGPVAVVVPALDYHGDGPRVEVCPHANRDHVALALERRRVLPAAAKKLRAKSKALLFLGAAAAAADEKGDY